MRIACVYLPSFPLQAHIRLAPHLAGTSMAVTDGAMTGARIVTCSRAAWAEGVRPGMSAATARAIAPDMEMAVADRVLYDGTLRALVDSLLVCSDVIEVVEATNALAPHRAIFLKVPPRSRGVGFGQRLLTQISRQGFRGRVGVADDRFTARLAAVRVTHRGRTARLDQPDSEPPLFHQSCTSVPRGGSAAFLAPLPLSYLPIDPDVQNMLETCGVKTLGDFAALPPPSVSRPMIEDDSDFQALARGHGSNAIRGQNLDDVLAQPLVERMKLPYEFGDMQPLSFALRTLCDHINHRLIGRQRAAAACDFRLRGPDGGSSTFAVSLARPSMSGAALLDAITRAIETQGLDHAVVSIEADVTRQVEPSARDIDLFARMPAPRQDGESARQAPVATFRLTGNAGRPHIPPRRSKRARRHRVRNQQVLGLFD